MSLIPYVIERTASGERSYDIFSRLHSDRIIMLHDQVSDASASVVIAQMLHLESVDANKPIYLYINSPGGSVTAGMAIFDTMQYVKCPVATICMGMAASMGAFLLVGGEKGMRYCMPNAEVMIHQPLISGGLSGQCTDIKIHADNLVKTREKLESIMAERSGNTLEDMHKWCERDNYLSAEEALKLGLIDEILYKRT